MLAPRYFFVIVRQKSNIFLSVFSRLALFFCFSVFIFFKAKFPVSVCQGTEIFLSASRKRYFPVSVCQGTDIFLSASRKRYFPVIVCHGTDIFVNVDVFLSMFAKKEQVLIHYQNRESDQQSVSILCPVP